MNETTMAYGFNISKADKITTDIAAAYENFGKKIASEWTTVQSTMQNEWIGPDQQDFELKFVERVCDMYEQCYNLATTAIQNVEKLTNGWIEFQNKNTISGEALGTAKTYASEAVVTVNRFIISRKSRTFTDADNMGLANATSASNISQAFATYAANLKSGATELFGAIDTTNAFFGSQQTALKKYVETIGDTMAEISSAIKDLDIALATLANTNYTTSDSTVETELTTANTETEKLTADLGKTRWTTE